MTIAYWTKLPTGDYATSTAADGPFSACPVADASLTLRGALEAHEFYHGPVERFLEATNWPAEVA